MFTKIKLQQFRCLSTEFLPSPTVNIICGDNGSGKSSILESIHYLAYGRSFRTATPGTMIQYEAPYCSVHADLEHQECLQRIGLTRSPDELCVRLNGNVATLSKVSSLLPSVFIDSHSHRTFFASKSTRRTFFDWLTFHVKHNHMLHVRRYAKVLQARNSALKKGYDQTPWDAGLVAEAERIHLARSNAFALIRSVFQDLSEHFGYHGVTLEYQPGYCLEKGLQKDLQDHLMNDRMSGRTSVGPHACVWRIVSRGGDIGGCFSQGQQKMMYFALVCAKYEVMRQSGLSPMFLMDDFAAELDSGHKMIVSDWFGGVGGQCFVTSILQASVPDLGRSSVFHVKQGSVVEC